MMATRLTMTMVTTAMRKTTEMMLAMIITKSEMTMMVTPFSYNTFPAIVNVLTALLTTS